MSDDRISADCPYCGDTYNLLSSQAGNWFKCRNDQCRRGFIVEGPSGSTDRSDTDLPTSPLNTQSETEVSTPAGADSIVSLEGYIAGPVIEDAGDSIPSDTPANPTPSPTEEQPSFGEIQELEATALGQETDDVEADPGASGDTAPEVIIHSVETNHATESESGDSTSTDGTTFGGADGSGFTRSPGRDDGGRKPKGAKLKWVAAATLLAGLFAATAIVVFRPAPNEITDWTDAVRLYEEKKWNKAKRAFKRYESNFPENPHAQEIPFFVDMCDAGDDIFSRTGDPDRGWKRIEAIYKNHRDNPAYNAYAHRFREAIEKLKNTFVDQARERNQQVSIITPKAVITLDDPQVDFDINRINAEIQSKRSDLETAGERLDAAEKTLDLLENVSLVNAEHASPEIEAAETSSPETPEPEPSENTDIETASAENESPAAESAELTAGDDNIGRDIQEQREQMLYLRQRLAILSQLGRLLDTTNRIPGNQLDKLYDSIKGALAELLHSPPQAQTGGNNTQANSPADLRNIEIWKTETKDFLRQAYRRESQRIKYVPVRFSNPSSDNENAADENNSTSSVSLTAESSPEEGAPAQSLFVVRGASDALPGSITDNQVYFAIARGILYAFDTKGACLWARRLGLDSYALPVSVPSTATAPQRVVAVSTIENKLMALNARTGELDWEYQVDLDQNLSAPLTVISIPAIAPNTPPHVVGLLPTATGEIHVLELSRGRRLGIYEVDHPLLHRGKYDAKTGLVYFSADAKRVFAIDPEVIAKGLADGAATVKNFPGSPALLYTDHAAGSLLGAPAIVGHYLVTSELSGLGEMKIRAFEINDSEKGLDVFPEITPDPLK
ncbi:MAG: PQQ-binding-like beta-propeller repeat protein, partial [Pirellulales bacterium]|nr:PQQ-binding-like beta-propeller repeat protein [Pirellulales bacterium]